MVNEKIEILKILINNKEEKLSIRKISKIREINYKSAYNALKFLEKEKVVRLEKIGNLVLCSFNNQFNNLVFEAEYLKREKLFKNKDFLVIHNRLSELNFSFISLIFGSYAKEASTKHSDIDILTIGGDEKEIKRVISILPDKIHLTSVSYKDFIAMAKSRDFNVVNEAIKNNIILIGIEEYYRLLKNAH